MTFIDFADSLWGLHRFYRSIRSEKLYIKCYRLLSFALDCLLPCNTAYCLTEHTPSTARARVAFSICKLNSAACGGAKGGEGRQLRRTVAKFARLNAAADAATLVRHWLLKWQVQVLAACRMPAALAASCCLRQNKMRARCQQKTSSTRVCAASATEPEVHYKNGEIIKPALGQGRLWQATGAGQEAEARGTQCRKLISSSSSSKLRNVACTYTRLM